MNIQSKDKRQRILDATLELIAENGLHATPMSQVSKRSGVSAGTIYHYFSSKEELINHLYVDMKKAIADAAFRNYDSQASFEKSFLMMWQNSLDYLIANPLQLSFIEQCSISPLILKEAKDASVQYLAPLLEFISGGMDSGDLKNMDLQLLLYFIEGTIVSTAKLHLSGALKITNKHRDIAAQACWDGLKAS